MVKSWGVLTDLDKGLFRASVAVPKDAVSEKEYDFLHEVKVAMLWRELTDFEMETALEILDLAMVRT